MQMDFGKFKDFLDFLFSKKYALILFTVILSTFIFGTMNVYGAPTITITSPNGGELAKGTWNITWTASDADNSQQLDANLWYSNPAGQKNNLIVQDLNLLQSSVCNFTSGTGWQKNPSYITGLTGTAISYGRPAFFELNNVFYALLAQTIGTKIQAYSWNGSSWIPNYDLNVGLPIGETGVTPHTLDVFSIGSKTYLLEPINQFPTTPYTLLRGFSWNGSSWIPDYDINSGVFATDLYDFGTFNFSNQKKLMVLTIVNSSIPSNYIWKSYDWNGAGWTNNDSYAKDFNVFKSPFAVAIALNDLFFTFFEEGGTLKALKYRAGNTAGLAFSSGKWVLDYDANSHIKSLYNGARISTVNYNNQQMLFLNAYYATTPNDWNALVLNGNLYDTTATANCTYDWNTLAVPNLFYAIDINVFNGTTSTMDSSDGLFQVLNYSSSDINAVCVENCTTGYDGNKLVITPIDNSANIKFYVQNNPVAKSAIVNIRNSLADGKRYFVYSSLSDANYSFDDTLTFGSSASHVDGLQKIWNPVTSLFEYSFIDSYSVSQKKYYVLKYQQPMKSWNSLNNVDWDNLLVPQNTDYNGVNADIFQTNSYAKIQSELKTVLLNIAGTNRNYVFVFSGNDLNNLGTSTLYVGTVATKGTQSATTQTINYTERTYDFDSLNNGILSMQSSLTVSSLKLYDYALIDRGYFLQGIEVKGQSGNELPAIIDNNVSWQYVREGEQYRVQTKLFDREGKIKFIELLTYLETVADANLASYSYYDYSDITSAGATLTIDLPSQGLYDFTVGNKKMLVKMRVTDQDGISTVSSKWFMFIQFPYFPGDFSIKSYTPGLLIGTYPQTTVKIRNILPNTLRGVSYYIYSDLNSPDHSDYNKTFYVPQDFSCNGFDCSFNINVSDWIVPTVGRWNIVVSALLTTQYADWNSSLTAYKETFFTKFKEIEAARIFEAIERTDHTYRNDEPIVLVLQLRDKDYGNLKNFLDVKLQVSACGGAVGTSDCNVQDKNYFPDQYFYQANSGVNYWFWRTIFTDANGELMADGLYYRFKAILIDVKSQHDGDFYPVLTTKCQPGGYNSDYEAASMTNLLDANIGCNWPTPKIVSVDSNDFESRILIDASKDLNVPSFSGLQCLINDLNFSYEKQMEQSVICFLVYNYNETSIDNFKFYIANKYSDFSKTGLNKQYIEINIPYSLVLLNDIGSLKQEYSKEYSKTSMTVGQGIVYNLKTTNSFAASVLGFNPKDMANILTGGLASTIIKSFFVGSFQTDLNYDILIGTGSGYIEGIMPIEIKGIPIINMQEYVQKYPDLNKINPSDFVEYMNYKKRPLSIQKTIYTVFKGSVDDAWIAGEVESPIIINEVYDSTALTLKHKIDANLNSDFVPIFLQLDVIADIVYNINSVIRRSLVLNFSLLSEELGMNPNEWKDFVGGLGKLLTNPSSWLFDNAWWLFILLIVLLVVSIAWSNFKSGGVTINTASLRK